MGKWVFIPWVRCQNTMDRGVDMPWVGVGMPWVGGRYTMGMEVDIPWVGRSKYHG